MIACKYNETDLYSLVCLDSWVSILSLRLSHAVKLNFVTIALADSFTCMSLSKLISLCSMCFKSQCSFSILPLTFICARTISTSSWSVRDSDPKLHLLHFCYHQHLHSMGSMRIRLKYAPLFKTPQWRVSPWEKGKLWKKCAHCLAKSSGWQLAFYPKTAPLMRGGKPTRE